MDLEQLRPARSLYYQCFGELFSFSFSSKRLNQLKIYLELMCQYSFDENLKANFDPLLAALREPNDEQKFINEYERLFLSLKDCIPTTFSYLEDGFENSKALLEVRKILAKTKIRRNEIFFKEAEDSIGFVFLMMAEFLRQKEESLATELFVKCINASIDTFLNLILENPHSKLYKELAFIMQAFVEFERVCFMQEKPQKIATKKVQNDLSRSEFLRRETNKKRRKLEKSQTIS